MKKNIFFSAIIFLFFTTFFANAQTLDDKIFNLFLQKQYAHVISAVENAETINATHLYYAGLSAEALEDAPLAAFYFKKSLVLDTTFTPAKISLAQALYQNEEILEAMEIFSKLLETDTLNSFLWGCLGDCYSKIALHPLAYSCYHNAFYLNPRNSSNTLKLVASLGASTITKNVEEAIFYCDSTLIYNENNKPLLRKKASILFINKLFLEAAPVLEHLMSLRDSSFATIKQAGICQAVFRNHDEAIFLLRKAHKQVKNDMEVMLHFATSLSHKPEFFKEAVEVIEEIRKNLVPDSAIIYQTHSLLAQCYVGQNDNMNAIIQYYYSMNNENKENRLMQMAYLANHAKPETSQTLLWYVHYYFLQQFKPEYEKRIYSVEQKQFSQFLLNEYVKYMHVTGKKKVTWQTFDNKLKTFTMDDLRKMSGGR
jgi:tetratricopeptide (TPR) repeat protein